MPGGRLLPLPDGAQLAGRGLLGRPCARLVRPLVLGVVEKAFLPPLNRVRPEVGAPPVDDINEAFRRPPLLIHMTAEPFEYPRCDWPGNVVMVGPCGSSRTGLCWSGPCGP